MSDREKLIELLRYVGSNILQFPCDGFTEALADHLLANGVTFAKDIDVPGKWISVKDRLPVETYQVLTVDDTGWIEIDALGWEDWMSHRDVTHWMPLPEPPKENQE